MSSDVEYLANYKPDTLYVNPAKNGKGAYASLLAENEVLIGEIEVTERFRLAVSAFYVNEREDYSTFKLTKLKYHKTHGWNADGEISINNFQLAQMKEFISLISSLNLKDAGKTKISVGDAHIDVLDTILRTDSGAEVLRKIADNPELSEDIFALAHKKAELQIFDQLLHNESYRDEYIAQHGLKKTGEEEVWQNFFECNPWIFGHGLNYIFLDKTGKKLESVTTGHSHESAGKRVDALMRTRAMISQYVLIEIKTPSASLLKAQEYRSGCWAVHSDLSDAVTQVQKTAFDFTTNQYHKIQTQDHDGRITGEEIFRIQPKSYLVIGNLTQLQGNDNKFACFHLYRTSLTSPEILTYDELYERAKCIVETISHKKEVA
jgi:hypothetical protein